MHKITIHESAAYVIGRRGMGFNEKLSFYKADAKRVKELVFGTLAEKSTFMVDVEASER